MARHAHETSLKPHFTPRESEDFIRARVIETELDDALERERRENNGFPVSRIISEELITQQEAYGSAMERTRAYMKALSVPLHELIAMRLRNAHPSDTLKHEINHSYLESGALLRDLTTERNTLEVNEGSHRELTGAISELAFFTLALRTHEQHGFVVLPSRLEDDIQAERDKGGRRQAFDFTITNEQTPQIAIPIQVKTGNSFNGPRYNRSVPVISLEQLANNTYSNGKYALPRALGMEALGRASQFDIVHLANASDTLTKTLQSISETYEQ